MQGKLNIVLLMLWQEVNIIVALVPAINMVSMDQLRLQAELAQR